VLERTSAPAAEVPTRELRRYAVRYLERFPLGTPYTEVGARLARMFAMPPLAGAMLGVDQTGVGKPVVDLMRRAPINARLRPVTLTAGHRATYDERGGSPGRAAPKLSPEELTARVRRAA
jgi:hypothetical protein